MKTENPSLSLEFFNSLEPLTESPRVGLLVSLFEARRDILIGLESGILPLENLGLDVDEFEFLLVVDALNRESAGSVTIQRMQQEMGVSAATVHRRLRLLRLNEAWLQDSKNTSEIRFSGSGLSSWQRIMSDLLQLSDNWLSATRIPQLYENLIDITRILEELKQEIRRQTLAIRANSPTLSMIRKPYTIQKHHEPPSCLEVVSSIFRLGRQLSPMCNDLAKRHGLNLHEADILVVLALHLSEEFNAQKDNGLASDLASQFGWDSFFDLARYLVHTQGSHPSVFSRAIKRLGPGPGNLGLIEVSSRGRTKATRVSPKGYELASRIWKEYVKIAEDLLVAVPDDAAINGRLIAQEISLEAIRAPKVSHQSGAFTKGASGFPVHDIETHALQPEEPIAFEAPIHKFQPPKNNAAVSHLSRRPNDKTQNREIPLVVNSGQPNDSARSKRSNLVNERPFPAPSIVADGVPRKYRQGPQSEGSHLHGLQREIADLKHLVYDRDCEILKMRHEILSLREDFFDLRKSLPNKSATHSMMGA